MAESKITIKKFEQEYTQQVIELIVGIQTGEFGVNITANEQPDLNEIPKYYQESKGNFWVALLDDVVVVGTIALADIHNGQLALRKMFVKKQYRGKPLNIAQNLIETAKLWSNKHSINQIYLGTVPDYKAAHRFYEKHGFYRIDPSKLPKNFNIMEVDKYFYCLDLTQNNKPS